MTPLEPKFLVMLLTFNELVSLFMVIIKILCGIDKIQNIVIYFSSSNGVKNLMVVTQTHAV